MSERSEHVRDTAFGQDRTLSTVDRFGIWLSARAIRRRTGSLAGKRLGDFGCGYDARFVRTVLDELDSAVLVDVRSGAGPGRRIRGSRRSRVAFPRRSSRSRTTRSTSSSASRCSSISPRRSRPLRAFHRILRPGGVCLLNVPSWRGKRYLELSAFRLHLSPPEEMDDHKSYYDPRDLWPLLVEAGFLPSGSGAIGTSSASTPSPSAGRRAARDDVVLRDVPRGDGRDCQTARRGRRRTAGACAVGDSRRRRPALRPRRRRLRRARVARRRRLPEAVQASRRTRRPTTSPS